MRSMKRTILWSGLFALIFALSLDFWRWGQEVELTVGNFPSYLIHFVILQFLFAGAIWLFIRKVWQKDDEDGP